MEHEQVTRLPQTTMATQKTSAAPADDLHRLILVRQAWIDGHQAINAEMLAFWQSRLKAGLAVGGQLLECTSVDSVLEVQLDYAKAALQAYLDQSARITGLADARAQRRLPPRAGRRRVERADQSFGCLTAFWRPAPAACPVRSGARRSALNASTRAARGRADGPARRGSLWLSSSTPLAAAGSNPILLMAAWGERSGREWAFLRISKSFIIEVCTRCG